MELAIFSEAEKIPNKSHKAISSTILKVEHETQNTTLYKLDVSRESFYVANNILASSK
jgi:translation elongation factor EF-Tu-like GTPase